MKDKLREKLIDLINDHAPDLVIRCPDSCRDCNTGCAGKIADHLIANGVVIIDPQKYPPVTGRDIIDTIMGVPLDQVAALIKEKENGKSKQSEWISVTERMPLALGKVLVYSPILGVYMTCYTTYSPSFAEPSVTHWMPLPEPPEMKGGE